MLLESLFDGTLGDWKLPPVSFELKRSMKPYHGRPYPIQHKHKAILMKEIKRLCNIGVLEWQPSLRWALPTCIIPKKDSTACTISDFRELNKCIVIKPYPIPKISTILQELEGITYVTALDLSMGYYTIRLDPTASKMCTIIFPWGKYSYKRLPMGFGGSACENILCGYLYDGDLTFAILKGMYGYKFLKRFLKISSRDLTPSLLFCQSNLSKDLITQSLVPVPFPLARLNALQAAVKHSHSLSDPCAKLHKHNKHQLRLKILLNSNEKERIGCNGSFCKALGAACNLSFGK
jgi:hypothetical protein